MGCRDGRAVGDAGRAGPCRRLSAPGGESAGGGPEGRGHPACHRQRRKRESGEEQGGEGRKDKKIPLNLKGASIDNVIDFIRTNTGKTVVKAKDVQAHITIATAEPVTPEAAVKLIFDALRMEGIAVVETDDTIQLLPAKKLSEMGVETRTITVRFADPTADTGGAVAGAGRRREDGGRPALAPVARHRPVRRSWPSWRRWWRSSTCWRSWARRCRYSSSSTPTPTRWPPWCEAVLQAGHGEEVLRRPVPARIGRRCPGGRRGVDRGALPDRQLGGRAGAEGGAGGGRRADQTARPREAARTRPARHPRQARRRHSDGRPALRAVPPTPALQEPEGPGRGDGRRALQRADRDVHGRELRDGAQDRRRAGHRRVAQDRDAHLRVDLRRRRGRCPAAQRPLHRHEQPVQSLTTTTPTAPAARTSRCSSSPSGAPTAC